MVAVCTIFATNFSLATNTKKIRLDTETPGRIPYTRHITNDEVRSRSNCQPLSSIFTSRRLRFFGHIARSSPDEDHHRAIAAAIRKPPPD